MTVSKIYSFLGNSKTRNLSPNGPPPPSRFIREDDKMSRRYGDLENGAQSILREAEKILQSAIPKMLVEMKELLIAVGQWSDEGLFAGRFILAMQGIDAIVRLSGAGEECKDGNHAAQIYLWALDKFRKIDIKFLSILFAISNDYKSMAVMVRLWLFFLRVDVEINARMRKRLIGLDLLKLLHENYKPVVIEDLMNQTKRRALKGLLKISHLKNLRIESSKDMGTPDFKQGALLKYKEWLIRNMEESKKMIDRENYEEAIEIMRQCYSALKNECPLSNPLWDDCAPRFLYCLLGLLLPYLPMLSGQAEKIPLKLRDELRTQSRRDRRMISFDTESFEDEEEGYDPARRIELVRDRKQEDDGELASSLVGEVIRDTWNQFPENEDKVIAYHFGKSDQEIADEIFILLKRRITKQAVRKRRIKTVEPGLKKSLEIRRVLWEEQHRDMPQKINLPWTLWDKDQRDGPVRRWTKNQLMAGNGPGPEYVNMVENRRRKIQKKRDYCLDWEENYRRECEEYDIPEHWGNQSDTNEPN